MRRRDRGSSGPALWAGWKPPPRTLACPSSSRKCRFHLGFSLDSILSATGAVLNLLSICCNETPIVDEFRVRIEKEDLFAAKAFVRMRGYNAETKEGFPYPAPTVNDIGGAKGIAKWLEVSEKYGTTVGLLTSNWFNERAYSEDKFARVYTAVEGLVREKYGVEKESSQQS